MKTELSMPTRFSSKLPDEKATVDLGTRLASLIGNKVLIFLMGELGAGKTTLSRGLLRGLGHAGAVKSPTFTLVEPYTLGDTQVFHFDLYRLSDPDELEYIGVDDYLDGEAVCLVEWPERGDDALPVPDLLVILSVEDTGRGIIIEAKTERGEHVIRRLNQP
jgi:tRNA threonylcarbamoyladenosine biosynthesis protein TsaE